MPNEQIDQNADNERGGSYTLNDAGERVLVERTDWTPPAAPAKKGKAAPVDAATTEGV